MEGGRKIDIDLESGIDVKSSDMLVSLSAPKFAHNRQRWQGHVLPTSLRYEHNGWAAGWYVYEFKFSGGYVDDTTLTYGLSRLRVNSNPTYMLRLHDRSEEDGVTSYSGVSRGTVYWVAETSLHSDFMANLSYGNSGNRYTINCTFNGKNRTFVMTVPSGAVSNVPKGLAVTAELNSRWSWDIMLEDTEDTVSVDTVVKLPGDIVNSVTGLPVAEFRSYDGTWYTWESTTDKLTYSNGTTMVVDEDSRFISELDMSLDYWAVLPKFEWTAEVISDVQVYIPYISDMTFDFAGLSMDDLSASQAVYDARINGYSRTSMNYFDNSFYQLSGSANVTLGIPGVISLTVPTSLPDDILTKSDGYKELSEINTYNRHSSWNWKFHENDSYTQYSYTPKTAMEGRDCVSIRRYTRDCLLMLFDKNALHYPANVIDPASTLNVIQGINQHVYINNYDMTDRFSFALARPVGILVEVRLYNSDEDEYDTVTMAYQVFCTGKLNPNSGADLDWYPDLQCLAMEDIRLGKASSRYTVESVSFTTMKVQDYIELLVLPRVDERFDVAPTGNNRWYQTGVKYSGYMFKGYNVQYTFRPNYYNVRSLGVDNFVNTDYRNTGYASGNNQGTLNDLYDEDTSHITYQNFAVINNGPVTARWNLNSSTYKCTNAWFDANYPFSLRKCIRAEQLDGSDSGSVNNNSRQRQRQITATNTTMVNITGMKIYCHYRITYKDQNMDFDGSTWKGIVDLTWGGSTPAPEMFEVKNVVFSDDPLSISTQGFIGTYTRQGGAGVNMFNLACTGVSSEEYIDSDGNEKNVVKATFTLSPRTDGLGIFYTYESNPDYATPGFLMTGDLASVNNTSGHMKYVDLGDTPMTFNMTAEYVKATLLDIVNKESGTRLSHSFGVVPAWSDYCVNFLPQVTKNMTYTINTPSASRMQQIRLYYVDTSVVTGSFNMLTGTFAAGGISTISSSYAGRIKTTTVGVGELQAGASGYDSTRVISFLMSLANTTDNYEKVALRLASATNYWTVLSYADGTARLYKDSDTVSVDVEAGAVSVEHTVSDGSVTVMTVEPEEMSYEYTRDVDSSMLSLTFTKNVTAPLTAVLSAAYGGTLQVASQNAEKHTVGISYNDRSWSFDLGGFENNASFLDVTSHDVRVYDGDAGKDVARITCDENKTMVRQAWDTDTTTENFWWADDSHVLRLTKDRFILLKKRDEYDDWQGNKWDEDYSIERTGILSTTDRRYICASAYGTDAKALFVKLTVVSSTKLYVWVYDPMKSMDYVARGALELRKVNLGQSLSSSGAVLTSYSKVEASSLLSEARLSATVRMDRNGNRLLILGLQYDRNMNQWAVTWNVGAAVLTHLETVQGYGCVGVDGSLTGGALPYGFYSAPISKYKCMSYSLQDVNTLSSTIEDVTDVQRLRDVSTRVVGNEDRQWYITRDLYGVISHLTFDEADGLHKYTTENVIPIKCSYDAAYDSPSFFTRVIGDAGITMQPLKTVIPEMGASAQAIWNVLVVAIGYPIVFAFNPNISTVNYLQQTVGQYAYVHYNSSIIRKQVDESGRNMLGDDSVQPDPSSVDMDELSFDVMRVPQEQTVSENAWSTFIYALGAVGISALEYNVDKVKVNTAQNQTATGDKGNKYSQMFLKNLSGMLASGFEVQSVTPTLKSEVTALKTLDMFYSTSTDQHVYAGPGFTNLNFVAQCVAQSATSVQLESNRISYKFIVKALTMYQLALEVQLLKLSADLLSSQKEVSENTWTVAGAMTAITGFTVGAIAAYALAFAEAALRNVAKVLENAATYVEQFLDALGADRLTSTITAKQSRHEYDIEAKHKYGSKSESFMWPCFGCFNEGRVTYSAEKVKACTENRPWTVDLDPRASGSLKASVLKSLIGLGKNTQATTTRKPSTAVVNNLKGSIGYYEAACYGTVNDIMLPDGMAAVVGASSFLPAVPFKNQNIGESEPVFPPPPIQDYVISKDYELAMTCTAGEVAWVSVRDTKLFDGAPSNVVLYDGFCGVAAPHTAIEVMHGIDPSYLRPWAVTPDALAINVTGINCFYDERAYHAFDGVGYRITSWIGASGMNKEHYTLHYSFQVNDEFKRSNKLPPNQFMGNFTFEPNQSLDTYDTVWSQVSVPSMNKGMEAGTTGEDRDVIRYSVPVFTEFVSTLPAVVKSLQPYKLAVVDGITSLTTDVRSTQGAYKTPPSYDFIIGQQLYRSTNEYICKVDTMKGASVLTPLVPTLGMNYIGATPFEAFFYSQATRQYYSYAGGTDIRLVDMMERFRDVPAGRWDFVNQDVVAPCLMSFDRLDPAVYDDDDESDNIFVLVLKDGGAKREVTPPNRAIFRADKKKLADSTVNADSSTDLGFRTLSLPAGLTYQGPNRCIINRYTWSEYMLEQVRMNKGRWKKVPKEKYHPFREYRQDFNSVGEYLDEGVIGWTHNPFLLVTSPLGVNEETDCKYEWEITFAWTIEMDQLYSQDEYVCVNVASEIMSPGGKVMTRPTHIYLTKELFTRTGNYGYYSFRYQGNGGIGNRERLHVWSDGYIAVSSVQVEYKAVTQKRTEVLTSPEDVKGMREF